MWGLSAGPAESTRRARRQYGGNIWREGCTIVIKHSDESNFKILINPTHKTGKKV
jgi:hypothetical protein